ncbi:hypothetical protein HYU10_00245 [Candidatus Woesearchaeota archaeon]|nr:hypothetical protein [Candidatus Woesearchaeota archaeon]
MSKAMYRNRIDEWKKKNLLVARPDIKKEKPDFLNKARHNLRVALALLQLSENQEAKVIIGEKEEFQCYDWVINASYYSMYQAALGLLAKIGYKSEDHNATADALYYFFVLEGFLEDYYVKNLILAKNLEETYVQELVKARQERKASQYSSLIEISREKARELAENAKRFVNRLSELILE